MGRDGAPRPTDRVDGVSKTHTKECTIRPCVCGSDTKRDVDVRSGDAIAEGKVSVAGTNCKFSTFNGNKMGQKTEGCAYMFVV